MTANRTIAAIAATMLAFQGLAPAARAANPMGYRLLPPDEAATLPHNHGGLGMDIERAQQITDDALTFDIIRIKQVHRNSPGAQAGFNAGDQIIAVDGRVFPSLATFAAYVGSIPPGTQIQVDTIPANGGPKQAQRIAVTVGESGKAVAPARAQRQGMSTGEKIAIGVGAAALLGCYEMGCFTHRQPARPNAAPPPFSPARSPAPPVRTYQ